MNLSIIFLEQPLVYLFEQTFGVKFINEFQQHKKTKAYKELRKWNNDNEPSDKSDEHNCRQDNSKKYCARLGKIKDINHYDFLLYDYAKYVFFKRIQFFRQREIDNGMVGIDYAVNSTSSTPSATTRAEYAEATTLNGTK